MTATCKSAINLDNSFTCHGCKSGRYFFLVGVSRANQRASSTLSTVLVYTKSGYSSVSELESFPTLATRLPVFCLRVHHDQKVITLCEFELRLNCKQQVIVYEGTKTFVCKYCSVFFLCENPRDRWLSMKKSAAH